MSELGHNSNEQLRSIVDRIQNLGTQIEDLQKDQKEIYAEAKSNGFCPKTLRRLVSICKQDTAKREQAQAILDSYMHALGMAV